MRISPARPARATAGGRSLSLGALAAALWIATAGHPAGAGDDIPFAARNGLEVASDGAHAWAPDAVLIYLENDEDLDAWGTSVRWGYLFYSPMLDKARAYSVRDGKIVAAENLEMRFTAPPLFEHWLDSTDALAAAEQSGGRAFRQEHAGHLSTMLLMRGAFQDEDPDQTTWTVVYTSPRAPALFVVVDAKAGKVRRTWRG